MSELIDKPKISIGIPVYNGEKLIEKTLNSILKQTYQDFEIVISDNASTDSTQDICKNYVKIDNRIKYHRQSENMGPYWNFNYVLEQALGEYFTWFAIDDIHAESFLEKNLRVLEENSNVVASISNVKYFGPNLENIEKDNLFQKFKNIFKYRFDKPTKFKQVFPAYGTYEKKATLYLRMDRSTGLYAVFRKSIIKKSMIVKPFASSDLAIILNVLKHGDFHVIDEILMEKYLGGYSSKGIIHTLRFQNTSDLEIVFMSVPFTSWCAKNLGWKIFLKNFDWFVLFNIHGFYLIFSDLIHILQKK